MLIKIIKTCLCTWSLKIKFLKKIVINGNGISYKCTSKSSAKNGVETFSNFHFRQVKFMFYIDDGTRHCACPSHRSHCSKLLIPAMLENWSGERHLPYVIVFTTLNYRGWVGCKKLPIWRNWTNFVLNSGYAYPIYCMRFIILELNLGMFGGMCYVKVC